MILNPGPGAGAAGRAPSESSAAADHATATLTLAGGFAPRQARLASSAWQRALMAWAESGLSQYRVLSEYPTPAGLGRMFFSGRSAISAPLQGHYAVTIAGIFSSSVDLDIPIRAITSYTLPRYW
jgi:hypothetical protein